MKISRVEEMRWMDRHATESLRIPAEILMENAGQGAAAVLAGERGLNGKRYVVLCGMGNNGGDGFVVARKILSNGGTPKVYILGDPGRFQGAARTNLDMLALLPVEVQRLETITADLGRVIRHADGVIDAIFGTGLDREVGGLHREVIDLANRGSKWVLSLDIPSGVNGDTGEIMGTAIQADCTVTFGLPKLGNVLYPGHQKCGKLFVTHISFPPGMYNHERLKIQTNDYLSLPFRGRDVHKGSMGDVLFVAGAANYLGAPYFSAMSFLKGGGGYARLAAPASVVPVIAGQGREIVFVPLRETKSGAIGEDNYDDLMELSSKVDMVVIGPGLSLDPQTQDLVRKLVPDLKKPVLIDGDGITAVAGDPALIQKRSFPTVMTPHAGEMARITGQPVTEIRRRRIDILQAACASWGAFIVLKGAHSLIGCPDGQIFINMTGNPGMATAGSGDVLTGAIAAMSGMGMPWPDAIRKGVYLHGLAGDLAACRKGEDGITAQDILDFLPLALKEDRLSGWMGSENEIEICP
jgi:ADP-dependent NAD(P)H-hydrate dehydratase / NAD(P)H-hydrate epimerase